MARRVGPVAVPELPKGVHDVARRWYASLAESGQVDYFEPSDWAAAVFVAVAMSKNIRGRRFSAPLFGVVWGAMNDLLTTEQARRRARIEVERDIGDQEERPGVTAIDEYRRALG
jgi:hypothetical protein